MGRRLRANRRIAAHACTRNANEEEAESLTMGQRIADHVQRSAAHGRYHPVLGHHRSLDCAHPCPLKHTFDRIRLFC